MKINISSKKKVGLALGSGSARGWAHIGVIKALEEANISIDFIAGTSIGAFVGAFYSSDKLDELYKFALEMDWKVIISYFDVVFPKKGLLEGNKIYNLVSNHILNINIEDLSKPFCAVATDINTGKEIRIKTGNIVDAVRASISIPGIFTPFEKEGMCLVDGGLANPVPVDVVREMGADIVIAVNLNHDIINTNKDMKLKQDILNDMDKNGINFRYDSKLMQLLAERYKNISISVNEKVKKWLSKKSGPNIFDIITNAINIMEYKITQANFIYQKPDILIEPALGHLKLLDFNQAEATISEGYNKTKQNIENIKKLVYE